MNTPGWGRMHAYLDGELSDAELRELRIWLSESPDHVRDFARACQGHALLAARGAIASEAVVWRVPERGGATAAERPM